LESISQKRIECVNIYLSMIEVMECDDESKSKFYHTTMINILKEKSIIVNIEAFKRIIPMFKNIEDLVKIIIQNYNPPNDPNSLFCSISASEALLIFNQFETYESKSIVDLMFHLIEIYSQKFYPKEEPFKISLSGSSMSYYGDLQNFLLNPLKLKHTCYIRNDTNFIKILQNCPQLTTQVSVNNANNKRYMPHTFTVNLTV
jgi:hypothetical protein